MKKQPAIHHAEMAKNEKKDQSENNFGEMDVDQTCFVT